MKRTKPDIDAGYGDFSVVLVDRGSIRQIQLCPELEVTVEDIVSEFGIPPAIEVNLEHAPEHPATQVNLICPEWETYFELGHLANFGDPMLGATTRVAKSICAGPRALDDWVAGSSRLSNYRWHPWPGYGSVKEPAPH